MSETNDVPSSMTKKRSRAEVRKQIQPIYYSVDIQLAQGGAPGWEFLNEDVLFDGYTRVMRDPWPDGYLKLPRGPWRMPDYDEPPKILISRKLGRPPRDLEARSVIWVISHAMKVVLESVDSQFCEFRRCETTLPSGELGRETWFCAINRGFVGAVDWDASEDLIINQHPEGGLSFSLNPLSKLVLRPEIIGEAPLFHVAESPLKYFCNQNMKDACKAAGLTGIRFKQLAKV